MYIHSSDVLSICTYNKNKLLLNVDSKNLVLALLSRFDYKFRPHTQRSFPQNSKFKSYKTKVATQLV
jgi:hypothetical protein